jgi:carbonic anhydrase/acetyltransferase-like protein (isoleucine patch superfamily)
MQKSGLILPFKGKTPRISKDAFIAPTASVIGDAEIGARTGIWFQVVIRADMNFVRIGEHCNLQDGTIVHVDSVTFPAIIGDNVTVGHQAIIHACTLETDSFVGMQAVVMDGAVVEGGAMVAAGALVPPGKRIPKGQLWAGAPAKYLRDVGNKEIAMMRRIAPTYWQLAQDYLKEGIGVVTDK